MSDPFGALATQRKGDTGIFNGTQYAPSGNLTDDIGMRIFGPRAAVATSATFGWQSAEGRRMTIVDGSSANPVTSGTSSVFITRESKITSGFDWGALNITLIADSGTTVQPEGINVSVLQNGNQDAVGIASNVVTNGSSHVAFAGYFQAGAKHSGSGAVNINTVMDNSTGSSHTFDATTPANNDMVGMSIQSISDNSHTCGTGVLFVDNGPKWDVGIGFMNATCSTAAISEQSGAAIGIDMSGSHSTAGIRVTNNDNTYMYQLRRTSATSGLYGMLVNTSGQFSLDEPGVAVKLVIGKGTPGANKTCLFIQEGAGPTLRQVTTFDPGAAGVNFTAGQLVMVAV